ncbi:hypothetical protein [Burkholderia cenocepacia]|uniref:hypothetical protein n=2 Tax=Burkholderia TaxID=32008 RepID=UPI001F4A8B79|nr:hypothetical protein [Burkholderia cenocepacia]MDP9548295.1 hypothetical protein [Burkholderia cepacia]MDO5923945.1 hypothetical protein [Burkholderia cenocepacia]MDP9598531.1 hypothetical protein [Burkholderia cepacia]MDP9626471.1 hypothetical protein [Burkholderia cepacia]MDP9672539.1 hypothetical protein [Burkholderia cepacia]
MLGMSNPTSSSIEVDRERIERLGGSAAAARLMGLTSRGAVQRVNNWKTRGIPADVKLAWPDLFLHPLREVESTDASDDVQPPAGTPDRKEGD